MGLEALGRDLSMHDQRLEGKFSGALVICGSARCLWDDLDQITFNRPDYMAINLAGMFLPHPVAHWYSNEWELLPKWSWLRKKMRDYPDHKSIYLHTNNPNADPVINLWNWSPAGTSSLGAVLTGLALGYDRIMVCGVPLDNEGHFYDIPGQQTNFEDVVPDRNGVPRFWAECVETVFDGKVSFASGRIREMIDAEDLRRVS